MATIDLTALRGYLTFHRQIHRLRPGQDISVLAYLDDTMIISNGIVSSIEAGAVVADLPRVEQRARLHRMSGQRQALNDGQPYRKNALRQGQPVHVIERYKAGPSCQVSGRFVTGGGDYFVVGGQTFDLGALQSGKRRQLRVMT